MFQQFYDCQDNQHDKLSNNFCLECCQQLVDINQQEYDSIEAKNFQLENLECWEEVITLYDQLTGINKLCEDIKNCQGDALKMENREEEATQCYQSLFQFLKKIQEYRIIITQKKIFSIIKYRSCKFYIIYFLLLFHLN